MIQSSTDSLTQQEKNEVGGVAESKSANPVIKNNVTIAPAYPSSSTNKVNTAQAMNVPIFSSPSSAEQLASQVGGGGVGLRTPLRRLKERFSDVKDRIILSRPEEGKTQTLQEALQQAQQDDDFALQNDLNSLNSNKSNKSIKIGSDVNSLNSNKSNKSIKIDSDVSSLNTHKSKKSTMSDTTRRWLAEDYNLFGYPEDVFHTPLSKTPRKKSLTPVVEFSQEIASEPSALTPKSTRKQSARKIEFANPPLPSENSKKLSAKEVYQNIAEAGFQKYTSDDSMELNAKETLTTAEKTELVRRINKQITGDDDYKIRTSE